MKQRKAVSMIGALGLIISAVVLITGCPQANNAKDDTGFDVKPTGKADPELKGRFYLSGERLGISFAEEGNIANILFGDALYTVKGEKIGFDLSSQIRFFKNMTEKKFILTGKILIKKSIADLHKRIKEAEEKGDNQRKTELEARLELEKKALQEIEKPDEKMKKTIKEQVKYLREMAGKMEPYAKIYGIFNNDKTRLTIEKFPVYDDKTKEVTFKEIVFEKQ